MDLIVYPSTLCGHITAIPSKSEAHRLLICAAFADKTTEIFCPEINKDIEATVRCLTALGADIFRSSNGYTVTPACSFPADAQLFCGESGSTLRFLLPIVGALGVRATFHLEGRLAQRPLSPLWEEMERMGCHLTRPTADTVLCDGKLCAGMYTIAGNVSSQYISGLLFAAALIPGECSIKITGPLESAPYVEMTQKALALFGVNSSDYHISTQYPLSSPGVVHVGGDWSNAAFFFAVKHLGYDIEITGLDNDSAQGDRVVTTLMPELTQNIMVDATDIPDLIPILAVFAACNHGATFTNIRRLRLKESDRVKTIAAMLENLGATVTVESNSLTVFSAQFHACEIDAENDHRIAMSAAIAALKASGPVSIKGAQCVEKSYPTFWAEYKRLGGNYEQYIR